MVAPSATSYIISSLPLRERGLKFNWGDITYSYNEVAPLAGAWIEMPGHGGEKVSCLVAPLAGAWIEIFVSQLKKWRIQSRSPCGSVD